MKELQKKINELNDKLYEIKEKRNEEALFEILTVFQSVLEEGDEIIGWRGLGSYSFIRPKEGYNRKNEYFVLRAKEFYFSDKKEDIFSEFETDMYSSSENSEWELKRLISCGKIAQILIDNQEELLLNLNAIARKYQVDISELNTEIWDLEKDVKAIEDVEKETKLAQLWDKILREGIEFEPNKDGKYRASINLTYGNQIQDLRSIKILSYSKSGRTAQIEVKFDSYEWENGKYVNTIITNIYNRVKVTNIAQMFTYYNNLIVK